MSKTWCRIGSTLLLVGSVAWSSDASADGVVDHLADHGNLRRGAAVTVTTKISRTMAANAARGGNDYDRIRQAIGTALFGPSGAGSTLQEYNERLAEVLSKLERGFDMWALTALFGGDSIVNCRQDFGLAKSDCRALAVAAIATPVVDVDGLLAEARTAFQSGNYSRAAEAYEQVTISRADDAAAFAGLGQSRIRIGDGRGAVQALRRAVELAPNVANLRAYLGRALMATGDRSAATTAFREALALNSNHLDAKAGLRELQSASAPPPPAPVSNTRTTAVASSVAPPPAPRFGTPRFGTPAPAPAAVAPQPSGGFGGSRFGSVQATSVAPLPSSGAARFGGVQATSIAPLPTSGGGGRFGAAASAAAAPSDRGLMQWVQKGDAHLQARQFPQALSAYNKAVAIDPNHAPAFAGIGVASMGAGDAAAASRALQTAVRLAPESADYNAALGNALAATGDTEAAKASYRRAIGLSPDHRAATAGLARLEGTDTAAAATAAAPAAAAPTPTAASAAGPAAATDVAPAPPPAPEPTPAEDDLIAGLLSDPLGPTPTRGRSGGSASAPSASGRASGGAAAASGPQTPSRDQIAEVMRELLPIVKACVPDRAGSLAVQITIVGATGAVEDATVVGSSSDDPEAICVGEVVRGATFPVFVKEKLSIKFPFQL